MAQGRSRPDLDITAPSGEWRGVYRKFIGITITSASGLSFHPPGCTISWNRRANLLGYRPYTASVRRNRAIAAGRPRTLMIRPVAS